MKTQLQELFDALLQVDNTDQMQQFLSDLCTPQELLVMAERWHVAKLLNQGIPYRQIYEMTGVSTATVTRVAKALNSGTGYRLLLDRNEDTKKRGKDVRKRSHPDRDSKIGQAQY